jgi:hypothetical protein
VSRFQRRNLPVGAVGPSRTGQVRVMRGSDTKDVDLSGMRPTDGGGNMRTASQPVASFGGAGGSSSAPVN